MVKSTLLWEPQNSTKNGKLCIKLNCVAWHYRGSYPCITAPNLGRTEPFEAEQYGGYETCRTASADLTRQAPSTEGALVYIFKFPKAKLGQKQETTQANNNNNETTAVAEKEDKVEKEDSKKDEGTTEAPTTPSDTKQANNATQGTKKLKKKKKKPTTQSKQK